MMIRGVVYYCYTNVIYSSSILKEGWCLKMLRIILILVLATLIAVTVIIISIVRP